MTYQSGSRDLTSEKQSKCCCTTLCSSQALLPFHNSRSMLNARAEAKLPQCGLVMRHQGEHHGQETQLLLAIRQTLHYSCSLHPSTFSTLMSDSLDSFKLSRLPFECLALWLPCLAALAAHCAFGRTCSASLAMPRLGTSHKFSHV